MYNVSLYFMITMNNMLSVAGHHCFTLVHIKMFQVYFSVMQSVLYPDERILERYDLKGCEAGRYTPLSDTTAQTSIAVLKDLNLGEKLLDLGTQ